MSTHTLEELSVPQPPYRMKRPEAVLAADAGEPVIASTEGEVLIPPPEALPPSPEAPPSPAERIAQSSAVMESANQTARDKLDKPSLTDATPEESGQDDANRQSSLSRIETTSAEGAAKVQEAAARSYNTLDDLERERDRLMAIAQQEGPDTKRGGLAMKGAILLGPMVEKKRAAQTQLIVEQQPEAAATPAPQEAKVPVSQMKKLEGESEGEFRQRKYAEKTPAKQKEEKTRSEDAAKAEDAAREEKKLEEGIEFKQPEESTTTKASRIGREALEKLNDFKDLQEKKGVTPEELEFARQQADLSQKRAEAAKRGENIPEERVDMAKVEAAGTFEGRDAALNARLKELMKATQDASEAGDKAGASAAAREFMKVRSDRIRLRNQREATQRPETAEQARATNEGMTGAPTPIEAPNRTEAIPQREPSPEERLATDYHLSLEQAQNRYQYWQDTATGDANAQAVYLDKIFSLPQEEFERLEEGKGASTAAGGTPDEQMPVVEPAPETPAPEAAGPTGLEDAFDAEGNLKLVPLEERPVAAPAEVGSERVNIKPGTAEAPPAAPAESAPTAREQAQEKIIALLQQRLAQFETQQPQPAASAEGASSQEKQTQGPGEGKLAELGIGEMGDTQEPGWWERRGISSEAATHAFASYWSGIWAKKAKDSLGRREKKIKELEKGSQEMADRSFIGTALNPIVYGSRLVWHKWRKGLLEAAQTRHDARRVEHTNYRIELLNGLAQRYDTAMLTYQERAKKHEEKSSSIDKNLDEWDTELSDLALKIAQERNPKQKEALKTDRDDLRACYDELARERLEADSGWSESIKQKERIQSIKNQILKYANLPTADTKPQGRERLQTRQKRQPNPPKTAAA